MLDAIVLIGYVLLIYSFFEKKVWEFIFNELFDGFLVFRTLMEILVLIVFISYFLNVWKAIGIIAFVFLLPMLMSPNNEKI